MNKSHKKRKAKDSNKKATRRKSVSEKERSARSETGLPLAKVRTFTASYKKEIKKYNSEIGLHQNKIRPGRKSILDIDKQAYMLLFFLKAYPTYNVIAFTFGVSKSCAHRIVQKGLNILGKILEKLNVMPTNGEGLTLKKLGEITGENELYIDGVERRINRPQKNQKEFYSGKKKYHTIKNLVITDKHKRILVITPTAPGKDHDFKMFKKNELGKKIPRDKIIYVDLGFLGIVKVCNGIIKIPAKKPRNGELTKLQLRKNRAISRKRVKVEHAIAGIKRLGAASNTFRGRKDQTKDQIMILCAGMWNLYLN